MAVSYDASFGNATACCSLASHRADVTSIVKPVIDGGAGGVYDFNILENADNSRTDGHALVVVYENAALPEQTVGILDGWASVTGDTATISFAQPLDPTAPGFLAEMALGINFSCCNQKSTVEVNGQLLTENAGNFDDGENESNGSLITVGSFDDPFSPSNPSYAEDTERYDLSPFITLGDTAIQIETSNASQDDNIFLALFEISGEADITTPNEIPLPAAVWLFIAGAAGLGAASRGRKKAA